MPRCVDCHVRIQMALMRVCVCMHKHTTEQHICLSWMSFQTQCISIEQENEMQDKFEIKLHK